MSPSPIDMKTLKIGALLNTESGSCNAGCEQEMRDLVEAAGLEIDTMWCGDGEVVGKALKELSATKLDVLIVLGGDGTIRSAAERCDRDGPYLIPLPGGTMNMLPKALYGEDDWKAALSKTLETPEMQPVNGGQIDDKRFYCAAIFGDPSRWAEAREAIREGDLKTAAERGLNALDKAFGRGLNYEYDDASGEAEAVSVVCPLASRELEDDATALEVVVVDPEGALDALKLAARALISQWRDDPNVKTAKVREVVVSSAGPIPAILDGETVELPAKVTVTFVRSAFKAIVPA